MSRSMQVRVLPFCEGYFRDLANAAGVFLNVDG